MKIRSVSRARFLQCTLYLLLGLFAVGTLLHAQENTEKPKPKSGKYVQFNFEQVELKNLVQIVGMHTGKRFVLDTSVTGRVSVITREEVPTEEVFPLFLSVLEGNGYTVVEREGTFHIRELPAGDPLQSPIVGPDAVNKGVGLVTRVIKLEHIRAVDARPLLEPMVRQSKAGSLSAFGPTNHLIISDTASNIARIEKLLSELDQPGQSTALQVVPIKHGSPTALAAQISAALKGAENAGKKMSRTVGQVMTGGANLPSDFSLVPAEQASSIIVSAGPVQMKQILGMIEKLDVPAGSMNGKGSLQAVFLNYLSAEAAAKQLNTLLAKRAGKQGSSTHIAVEADVANNAVIIDASPLDVQTIRDLLTTLDRPPQQVLVEVLIIEVDESDGLDLGVEWATVEAPQDGSTTVIGRSRPGEVDDIMNLVQTQTFPQGLSFGVATGLTELADGTTIPQIPFLIRALQQNEKVNILSNVPLRTQNNTQANVSVVENIPILTSTITGGTGDNRDVIQNIERIDVGIQLAITPQVNPNEEITLKLNPKIEAILDENVGAAQLTPTIARREVTNTITVPTDSSVIISGLLREDFIKRDSKVPLLGDIPILGKLFRSTTKIKKKTNLLIVVTPYIVTDTKRANGAKTRWTKKTGIDPEKREALTLENAPDSFVEVESDDEEE